MSDILWELDPAAKAGSQMGVLLERLRAAGEPGLLPVDDPGAFRALHRWSVEHRDRFWATVWEHCEIVAGERPTGRAWDAIGSGLERMAPPEPALGPRWYIGAHLNFAENLLRVDDDRPAIISWDERGPTGRLSFRELRAQVSACAAALVDVGVRPGERVAAVLPNVPETVIAMLASATIGAVWSSCSPDFGAAAILDRFGQIDPRVLFVTDTHQYGGKRIETAGKIDQVVSALPGLRRVVVVGAADDGVHGDSGRVMWSAFLAPHANAEFAPQRLAFEHPVFILYSSGTTGLPKGIVHGGGGTLVQISKEHALHVDIGPDDRLFYFTTCGWMMWNWLVVALARGAAIVLYDGAPLPGDRPGVLWDMAAAEGVTVFGTSAKYLALAEKQGLRPATSHDLRAVRAILSTGSPLAAHSFDYVYRDVAPGVQLASCSGGTDIVSCFVLGNPLTPVRRGLIQGAGLGMSVEIFDATGARVLGEPGELVCTRSFPSMPVAFWNDPSGRRYRAAYFDRFPNVWCHGDWAEETEDGGFVIYGRSDTTLNPGGVRIGTAEIYRQVEQLPEIVESVAVEFDASRARQRPEGPRHEEPAVATDAQVVLFLRLHEGRFLDGALAARIRDVIRRNTSPHHVPRRIHQVRDIPRTISGKIAEVAVRDAIHGRTVRNLDALANPDSLDEYRALAATLNW